MLGLERNSAETMRADSHQIADGFHIPKIFLDQADVQIFLNVYHCLDQGERFGYQIVEQDMVVEVFNGTLQCFAQRLLSRTSPTCRRTVSR
jgi:hypothetical protein